MYTQPPRRSSFWRWGCGLGLAGCLLAVMVVALVLLVAVLGDVGGMEGLTVDGDRLLLIRIDGVIVAGESGYGLFGGTSTGSDDIVAEIKRAAADPEIKGVLLRINSPGGSAAGSQEIYQAIVEARESGLTVVASMADIAASGGYYVAAPADMIFANPATLTGSIGVISIHQDMSGLFEKIGVQPEVVKGGAMKDMLGPTAPLSEEARQILQDLVTQVHEQFIGAVVEGRSDVLEEAQVRHLADGRIYTGQQAEENGLVDAIGGMQDALRKAGELAGIEGEPELEEPGPPSLLDWIFGGGVSSRQQPVAVTGGLLYDSLAARMVQGALGPSAGVLEEQ